MGQRSVVDMSATFETGNDENLQLSILKYCSCSPPSPQVSWWIFWFGCILCIVEYIDLLTIKTPKQNGVIKKKLTCKGTLRQVFLRVYRLEIKSVMLVFSNQLCELSTFSHFLLSSVNKYTVYTYTVCKGGGGEVWGSGPQTDKHLPQSPFTDRFIQMTFCIAFYESYLSMVEFHGDHAC